MCQKCYKILIFLVCLNWGRGLSGQRSTRPVEPSPRLVEVLEAPSKIALLGRDLNRERCGIELGAAGLERIFTVDPVS